MNNLNRLVVLSIVMFSFSVSGMDQSSWVGEYGFEEDGGETAGGTKIYIVHSLSVEKDESGNLKAHLYSQGFQTSVDIYARAKSVGNKLELYFEKKGDDHVLGEYENGAFLLSLEITKTKRSEQILTNWGNFLPTVPANEESGRVYFKRKREKKAGRRDVKANSWVTIESANKEFPVINGDPNNLTKKQCSSTL